jgi:hypothetical protein
MRLDVRDCPCPTCGHRSPYELPSWAVKLRNRVLLIFGLATLFGGVLALRLALGWRG